MNEMTFSVDIDALKQKIWNVLWQDETFRQWAGVIDPGTYMVGELKQGSKVQFISAENGYGVTSLVDKMVEGEYVLLKHSADTQESGARSREDEWTGGSESYTLVGGGNATTLILMCDVPNEMKEYFDDAYPKALQKLKELAEA